MQRRSFIKSLIIGGLATRLSPELLAQPAHPELAVAQGETPAAITQAALKILGGMEKFIGRGDKVLIKPNIGWDRTPEMAACTNPEVVRALVEMSYQAGAKQVIVMDNTINQARRCYVRSGIQEAAREAGAKVLFTDENRLKKMSINGEWLKEWDVFQDFVEVDKLINVPIAKVHSLSRVTLSLKNWLGAVGGNRNQFHQKIDQAMVDLAAFFKPTLTVLDAYRILFRNGPQGGRVSDTKLMKTVVAGVDQVAVDAYGATFFDLKPEEIYSLQLAQSRGLGNFDLEKLRIEKRAV
ncbi:MAG: DUF362 domain-containing protein [Acidobacteriota bacterium]|nr:DUF362 domain-containing protein [Acidobacteriota bacterium]MDW3228421.1 DUF362 domain-containing protein [Acidobacteriota bacterium]MDY0231299.1 DUF362 domain-containing protein [Candidatus Saccharicenans sp.]